jgi:hypothetical protein
MAEAWFDGSRMRLMWQRRLIDLLELFSKGNSSRVQTAWTDRVALSELSARHHHIGWDVASVLAHSSSEGSPSPKLSHSSVGAVGTLKLFPSEDSSIGIESGKSETVDYWFYDMLLIVMVIKVSNPFNGAVIKGGVFRVGFRSYEKSWST